MFYVQMQSKKKCLEGKESWAYHGSPLDVLCCRILGLVHTLQLCGWRKKKAFSYQEECK